jgi:hypothetical protein
MQETIVKSDEWDDGMEDPVTVSNRQAIITGVERANLRRQAGGTAAPTPARVEECSTGRAQHAPGDARYTKDRVRVTTLNGLNGIYRSCGAAFEELGLPMSSCIRFRMKLKASRNEVFEHEHVKYLFEIV